MPAHVRSASLCTAAAAALAIWGCSDEQHLSPSSDLVAPLAALPGIVLADEAEVTITVAFSETASPNTFRITAPIDATLASGIITGSWRYGPFPAGTGVGLDLLSGIAGGASALQRISGGSPCWLVEFEDYYDGDFNDLVLVVKAVAPGSPAPYTGPTAGARIEPHQLAAATREDGIRVTAEPARFVVTFSAVTACAEQAVEGRVGIYMAEDALHIGAFLGEFPVNGRGEVAWDVPVGTPLTSENQVCFFATYEAPSGFGGRFFTYLRDCASVPVRVSTPPGHTLLTAGNNTVNQQVYTTAAIAPAPNTLITVAVMGHRAYGATASPTLSGGGMAAWTQVATTTFDRVARPLKRLTIYRAMSAAPGSGPITITFRGNVAHCQWIVSQWDGVETSGVNGAGAIGQAGSSRGDAVSGLAVPLTAFGNPNNVAYGVFGVRSRVLAVSPGAGFREISEQPSAEWVASDLEAEWASNVNTIAATWTRLNAGALGVEIRARTAGP